MSLSPLHSGSLMAQYCTVFLWLTTNGKSSSRQWPLHAQRTAFHPSLHLLHALMFPEPWKRWHRCLSALGQTGAKGAPQSPAVPAQDLWAQAVASCCLSIEDCGYWGHLSLVSCRRDMYTAKSGGITACLWNKRSLFTCPALWFITSQTFLWGFYKAF